MKKRCIEALYTAKERSEKRKNSKMDCMRDSMTNWLKTVPSWKFDYVGEKEKEKAAQQSMQYI